MPERVDPDTGVVTESKSERKLKRPQLYKVLFHNDNYTTREFVVAVLREVFHKSESDAVAIMLHVHNRASAWQAFIRTKWHERRSSRRRRWPRSTSFRSA